MENVKEVKKKEFELESNSKPYLLKRLISDGFDIAIMFMLFLLVRSVALKTPLTDNYKTYYEAEQTMLEEFMLETGYGEEIDGKVVVKDNYTDEAKEALNQKIAYDENYINNHINLLLHQYVIVVAVILIVGAILFIGVPLTNKRRATLGMLLTGLTLFMPSRMTLTKWYIVLYRYIIMMVGWVIGALWVDSYVFLLMYVINLILILINKDQKTFKDIITYTMIIESKSLDSI